MRKNEIQQINLKKKKEKERKKKKKKEVIEKRWKEIKIECK